MGQTETTERVPIDAGTADFDARGWVRVPGAFSADDAAAMRDVTWAALEQVGIRRHDRATWTEEAPSHLQDLKRHPSFRAVGSDRTLDAIDRVLGPGRWKMPSNWGAFFVLFPTPRPWSVPVKGWHIDAPYTDALSPPAGLKIHALYGDIPPRAGGMTIVEGSHRLLAKWFAEHPPAANARAAQLRKRLLDGHSYLRDLSADGDRAARIERFTSAEPVDGIPVRVVELTAEAGDVILIHPLVLHTRPTNAGTNPRFLLNKDIRTVAPAS